MYNQIITGIINSEILIRKGLTVAAPFIRAAGALLRTFSVINGLDIGELPPFFENLHLQLGDGIFPGQILGELNKENGNIFDLGDMGDTDQPYHPCINGNDIYISQDDTTPGDVLITACNTYNELPCHDDIGARMAAVALVNKNGPESVGLPPTVNGIYPIDSCIDAEALLTHLNPDNAPIIIMKEPMTAYPDTPIKLPLSPEESAELFENQVPTEMYQLPPQNPVSPICGGALLPAVGVVVLGAGKLGTFRRAVNFAKNVLNR